MRTATARKASAVSYRFRGQCDRNRTYAVEVVARALAVEHARRGVVEKAGGKVGNAEHLHTRSTVSEPLHIFPLASRFLEKRLRHRTCAVAVIGPEPLSRPRKVHPVPILLPVDTATRNESFLLATRYLLLVTRPSLEPAGPRLQIVRAHKTHRRALLCKSMRGAHPIHNLPQASAHPQPPPCGCYCRKRCSSTAFCTLWNKAPRSPLPVSLIPLPSRRSSSACASCPDRAPPRAARVGNSRRAPPYSRRSAWETALRRHATPRPRQPPPGRPTWRFCCSMVNASFSAERVLRRAKMCFS